MVRGGGGRTKCRTCGSIKCNYRWCGGGGGVPSVGHVGKSSVIIDGAGGGGGYQVSDMWVNQV